MSRKGVVIGIIAAFVFIGLYWVTLNNMTADEAFQLEEYIGLGFLTLIAFGSIIIILSTGFGQVVFGLMEGCGDKEVEKGNTRAARLWYQRCIRLDDRLLNNTFRRIIVMGKLSKIYDHDGHPELVHQLELRSKRVVDKDKECRNKRIRRSIPESIENSWLYKYAFAILFTGVAIVYSINSTPVSSFMILVFGICLNGYWLNSIKDNRAS